MLEFNLYSKPPPWLVWRAPSRTKGPWQRVLRRPRRAWRSGRARRTLPLPLAAPAMAVMVLAALGGMAAFHPERVPGDRVSLESARTPLHGTPSTGGPEGARGPGRPAAPGPSEAFVPTRVVIPSIGVDVPVGRVGMTDDGLMEAPANFDEAAWFDLSAEPGEKGSSVIVGHRDRTDGPGIFWKLDRLKAGDAVTVVGADGRTMTFVVERSEVYPWDGVPMGRLFTEDRPRLNLLTCIGTYDWESRNYSDRLVVYAVLPG